MTDKNNVITKNIALYYADCIMEEARCSALRNVKNNKEVTYVSLGNSCKVFKEYPKMSVYTNKASDLINLMLKNNNSKDLQLVYASTFIEYVNDKGKKVFAPLLYAPCEIVRDKGDVCIKLLTDKPSLNVNSFIDFVISLDNMSLEPMLSEVPVLPCNEGDIDILIDMVKQIIRSGVDVKFVNESGLILAKINGTSASILDDLRKMKDADWSVDCALEVFHNNRSTLNTSWGIPPEKLPNLSLVNTSQSQKEAMDVALNNNITAIIGGPGCGKSNTITAIATSLISRGNSVLIASKMNEAIDVIEDRLEKLSPTDSKFMLRTGNKNYRKELSVLIENLLSARPSNEQRSTIFELIAGEEAIDRLTTEYNILVDETKKYKEIKEAFKADNFLNKIIDFINLKTSEIKIDKQTKKVNMLNETTPVDARMATLREQNFANTVNDYIRNINNQNDLRQSLLNISKLLIRKTPLGSSAFNGDFMNLVRRAVPCWLSTINDVSETIPCVRGLFDYVIIDETSQCDIASALPLLFRAKRAVIVGDNKQLKYISFMENRKSDFYLKSREIPVRLAIPLDYSKNSLFDFGLYFTTQPPVMLKEYFRGGANLMAFSNKEFYDNNIKCMSEFNSPIELREVANAKCDTKKTRNFEEAKMIVNDIKSIIKTANTQFDPAKDRVTSIGVLSPFKAQVELIKDLIEHQIEPKYIEAFDILVGTAHAFQGNEKDVMFMSWTVADNSHIQSHTFVNNPNLFNVAITRAKKAIYNYISMDVQNIPNGFLKRYLSSIK